MGHKDIIEVIEDDDDGLFDSESEPESLAEEEEETQRRAPEPPRKTAITEPPPPPPPPGGIKMRADVPSPERRKRPGRRKSSHQTPRNSDATLRKGPRDSRSSFIKEKERSSMSSPPRRLKDSKAASNGFSPPGQQNLLGKLMSMMSLKKNDAAESEPKRKSVETPKVVEVVHTRRRRRHRRSRSWDDEEQRQMGQGCHGGSQQQPPRSREPFMVEGRGARGDRSSRRYEY